MKHPNASMGLKMVFIAQFISIGAGVALGIGAMPDWIRLIITSGLAIAACVVEMVGLKKASKDHSYYGTAFLLSIATLILAVASGICSGIAAGVPVFSQIASPLSTASSIANILIMLFVVQGTKNLLSENGHGTKLGTVTQIIYTCVYLCAAVASLIVTFMHTQLNAMLVTDPSTWTAGEIVAVIVFGILAVGAFLCSITSSILYIVFIGRSMNRV